MAATGIAAALLLSACVMPPQESHMNDAHTGPTGQSTDDSPTANAADEMFATMMIVHHEQAIVMSEMLLVKDEVHPDVAAIAQRITEAQGPEINLMEKWLLTWGVDPDAGMQGMDHGDGMMSDDDMMALADAAGPEASVLYLEQMIVHHEGAIAMAEVERDGGQNPDAVALAQRIIDNQLAEITEMRELLAAL